MVDEAKVTAGTHFRRLYRVVAIFHIYESDHAPQLPLL